MAVHRVGQARVGLGHHRQAGVPTQLRQQRRQLVGAQRAVQTHGVGPQPLQCPGHGGHGAAGEGAASLVKGHGDEDRQVCVLLDGQQRRLGLIQVRHGLDGHQVRPGLLSGHGHLTEQLIGPLKGQAAHGFQQLTQGAHVQGHPDAQPRHRLFGDGDGGGDDLVHAVAGALEFQAVGTEGVGVDHLAACVRVFLIDGVQQLRLRQIQQLGLASRRQAPLLEHGAHGAVQDQNVVFQEIRVHRISLPCEVYRSPAWSSRRSHGCGPAGVCRKGR